MTNIGIPEDGESDGSIGFSLPVMMSTGRSGETINNDDYFKVPRESKPTVTGRKERWRSKKTRGRMDLAAGEIHFCVDPPPGLRPEVELDKSFDEFTVGDLRRVVGCLQTGQWELMDSDGLQQHLTETE